MISIDKKAHTTQIFIDKQKDVPAKKQLIARWESVNGKLVCRWVEV